MTIDDTVMYGINKVVRAWNWTTGKTKSDLANLSLNLGSIAESAAIYSTYHPISPYVIPLFFAASIGGSFLNKHNEKLEVDSLEKETIHPEVERFKEYSKRQGYWNLLLASNGLFSNAVLNEGDKRMQGFVFFTGLSATSFSFYVMRADSLPPRKSAFSRAKDYLSDKLSTPISEPIPEPIQIKSDISISYNPILENYLV